MPIVGGMVRDKDGVLVARDIRVYRRDTGVLLGQVDSAGGPAVSGDEHYNTVSLLLPFDGVNGSTSFIDASINENPVIAHGGVQISSVQSMFGGTAGYFPGASTDYLEIGPSDLFAFGLGDFTIECFVYVPAGISGNYAAICDIRNAASGAGSVLLHLNSALQLGYYGATTSLTSSSVPVAQWTHVELSRASSVSRLFIGGVLGAFVADSNAKFSNPCFIGRVYDNLNPAFSGYIDGLRITKGVARHTANFTPPSYPHPTSAIDLPVRATGEYAFPTLYEGEVQVVCLDDVAGDLENDLILRTFPV